MRILAAATLLATFSAPAPTQVPLPPELQTYRIQASVPDLSAFADLIEAWDKSPLEVLTLDLGPKAPADGKRVLMAKLQSPDMDAIYLVSREIDGFQFTSIQVFSGDTAAPPIQPTKPVKDPETGRYKLNFTHLDFGPQAEKGRLAVPQEIHYLDGQDVSLEGYMIPLAWDGDKVVEFMLVAHLAECCFGGAPEYDEWVHVTVPPGEPVEYVPFKPFRVQGKLVLPSVEPNKQHPDFDAAYRMLEAALEQGAK